MPPRRRSVKTSPTPKNLRQRIKRRLAAHRPPRHPGEILLEEYLKPWGMTATAFAKRVGIARSRLMSILSGKRDMAADDALRLARVLGTKADYWLNLQHSWNLWHAMQGSSGRAIAKLRPITQKASRSFVAKAMRAEKQFEAAGKRFVKGVREAVERAPTMIRQYRNRKNKP